VLLIGGWYSGAADVSAATNALQELAADSDFGLLIAADQEGGHIQQLQGPGFSTIPKALEQGALRPAELEEDAEVWGDELLDAGVNVNLAPVADTVPKSLGFDNAPIGFYSRQFSSKPEAVATHVTAVVDGLAAAGVASTLKHFPGLGRVDENTDFSADGITDPHTGPDDPYLLPFQAGIDAGADIVMVSSAVYPKIDKRNQAMFSTAVITDLLRGDLGFEGVVMTDDIGGAASVSHIPVGERATRFLSAGGDILLTVSADTVGPLLNAIADGSADPQFAALVDAAATRVVELKLSLGLVRGCAARG
jgi:beta-N-acetylhexosaminidase